MYRKVSNIVLDVVMDIVDYLRFGPPIRYWCMMYEGKHNYFKDMAHRVKSFKNIPKTMAQRHQEMLCYQQNSDSPYTKDVLCGPGIYSYSVPNSVNMS